MSTIKIIPSSLSGEISAITSKSAAHRALICAALCGAKYETSLIINNLSNDIETTINALKSLGAGITRIENIINVKGINFNSIPDIVSLNCRDSGSTLRFLLPLVCLDCFNEVSVKGEGRLPERPLSELCDSLTENGAMINSTVLPIVIKNSCLKSGEYKIPGNISSQYISGLMFALPLLRGDSEIILTSPLKSTSYVNMTAETLKKFGIDIIITENGFLVRGNQKYVSPGQIRIEGDWSNASFFLAAGALSDTVKISGLDFNSLQGDKKILKILSEYGAVVKTCEHENTVTIIPNKKLAFEADVSEIPDLLPILAVLGIFAEDGKETRLFNAARLRLKESDRLKTTAEMLKNLGGGENIVEHKDALIIKGGGLKGGTTDSRNDHRIAMSAAIAATNSTEAVVITDAEAVRKSYIDFFSDYNKLGGKSYVINDG